ncbi:MAG: hypothetical protein SNJ75_15740, partial [Gemmataceae bacterium]
SVVVGVTDTQSGLSHHFTFQGMIEGTLTQTQSTLTATFTGPLIQSEAVGENLYTVSIDPNPIAIPAPQPLIELLSLKPVCSPTDEVDLTGGALEALLSAQFLVTPMRQAIEQPDYPNPPDEMVTTGNGGEVPVNQVPEPSALLLGLLAGPAAWVLRRHVVAA